MTQIVTVSPATAAYASQGMKQPNTRANTLFEERIRHWSSVAKTDGDGRTVALLNVITPPALALALITAPNDAAQVTVAEAQRRYDENGSPAPDAA